MSKLRSINLRSHLVTCAKVVSYRTICGADTFCVTLLLTRNLHAAVGVVFAEMATKTLIYYGHERLWEMPLLAKFASAIGGAHHG